MFFGKISSPESRWQWPLLLLTVIAAFLWLGSRSLNEPDEGRYAEIAREMIQTGDWQVPHLWYLPHLDKPPVTYWAVGASMKLLGPNEWAVRLPVALAGLSGILATFCLARNLGGLKAALWSVIILQSSLLYFIMSRFVTPDILLTQFVAWSMYFFWKSWLCVVADAESRNRFWLWHLAGWTATALGFLTKGPIAVAIPVVSFGILFAVRRSDVKNKGTLIAGFITGFAWLLVLVLPWFVAVFQKVPGAGRYMIVDQVAGHLLGGAIKNRRGSWFYFFEIVAVGLLPWTLLLGAVWRRTHWRMLDRRSQEGWLMLNIWILFTFVLFSFSRAKLPAYILPIFPGLAVVISWRFFSGNPLATLSGTILRLLPVTALVLPAIFPLLLHFIFGVPFSHWMFTQTATLAVIGLLLFLYLKNRHASAAAGLAMLGMLLVIVEVPPFETNFKANQTLKPLGTALRDNYKSGMTLICFGRLPQGLPFYAVPVISPENRPCMALLNPHEVPFEFPGNRDRLGLFLLPDDEAVTVKLAGKEPVMILSFGRTLESFLQTHPATGLNLIFKSGQWELWRR